MAARKTKTTKPIVDWDIDEANYRGDGGSTDLGELMDAVIGWYMSSSMAADSLINSPRVMLRVFHKGHICFAEKEHGQTLQRLRSQHPLLKGGRILEVIQYLPDTIQEFAIYQENGGMVASREQALAAAGMEE